MRILHILDHSILLHSGYSFRIRNFLQKQRGLGWHAAHVTGLKQEEGPADEEIVEEMLERRNRWHFIRYNGRAFVEPERTRQASIACLHTLCGGLL